MKLKISNQELVKFLIENRTNKDGNIYLADIDFGDIGVIFSGIKAKLIFNDYQKATIIYNDCQEANKIYNYYQQADKIDNEYQKAYKIDNKNQVIKPNYETMSKEQLIARIKELENE